MKRTILLTIMAMNLALATPLMASGCPRPPILRAGSCVTPSPQTFQDWMFQLKLALRLLWR
jgi:hypothetical protein